MLTPQQESSLTSGGDCFEHWHSEDRKVTHDDSVVLTSLEKTQEFSSGTHSVDKDTDYVLVTTSGGSATINLPSPSTLRKITVIKVGVPNTVTIATPSGTINGAATLALTTAYAVAVLKAINGNYYKVA